KNHAVYEAILEHEHIDPNHLTDADLLKINDDYKKMQVIQMHPAAGGYRFEVDAGAAANPGATEVVLSGTVTSDGVVHVSVSKPDAKINCPICLARGVLIATPNGPVAVEHIR